MKWRMTGIRCHLPGGDFAGLIADAPANVCRISQRKAPGCGAVAVHVLHIHEPVVLIRA
jgi:hypothetical protein